MFKNLSNAISFNASVILRFLSILPIAIISNCSTNNNPPNVLIIIADDVGMAEIGAFGSEIATPNLDKLAYDGIRLKRFHTAATCSPTRAMLLTGVDNHLAGLGNMAEEMAPNQQGQSGYEGHLNNRVVSIASILKDNGYNTYFTGKWHLGMSEETSPQARGFERSFAMLSGGAHHFADMKPAYAPNPSVKAAFREDAKKLDSLPDDYHYSSQYLVDKLIEYIAIDDSRDAKPFFAVLSYMAPHWPLQAPDQALDRYSGQYDSGYETLALQRLNRQKQLGIIDKQDNLSSPPLKAKPWTSLTKSQRRYQARAMEIYATMVDEMDRHTGKLLNYLSSNNQLDNTIVVFLSDNGAEGHDLDETWPADLFPKIREVINTTHNFSYQNMGRPNSYVLYGPNWAWAGAPALRLHKGFVTEGGIRTPAFITYPKLLPSGTIHNGAVHVKDIVPTLLALLNISVPSSPYRGREIYPISGINQVPYLLNQKSAVSTIEVGEILGKRYVIEYPWKILHQPPPYGLGQWELYNLDDDLAESNNLAKIMPEKVIQLEKHWLSYRQQNNVILPNRVSGY